MQDEALDNAYILVSDNLDDFENVELFQLYKKCEDILERREAHADLQREYDKESNKD